MNYKVIISIILTFAAIVACHKTSTPMGELMSGPASNPADSLRSLTVRPYGVGYNLFVDADSLLLLAERPTHNSTHIIGKNDSLYVHRGDLVAIAAMTIIPEDSEDSVWIKIARDQECMGWVHESTMLNTTVPTDPVSRIIRNVESLPQYMPPVIALASLLITIRLVRRQRLTMLHAHDISSPYPTLMSTTLFAVLLLWTHARETHPIGWAQFYFHPTLNPWQISDHLVFMALLTTWLFIVVTVATFDELLRKICLRDLPFYIIALAAWAALLIIAVPPLTTASPLAACIVFAAYVIGASTHYVRHSRPTCRCGRCGTPLHSKGRCPHCGCEVV